MASATTPDWLLWTRRTNTMDSGRNMTVDLDVERSARTMGSEGEASTLAVRAEVKVSTPEGEASQEVRVPGPSTVAQRRIGDPERVRVCSFRFPPPLTVSFLQSSLRISRQSTRQDSRLISTPPGSPGPATRPSTPPGTPGSAREVDGDTDTKRVQFHVETQ